MAKTEDLPYMPLYIKDFLVDEAVVCMTNEQLGAYVRLLMHNWLEGSVPDDEQKLAMLARAGRRWGHLKASVLPLFPRTVTQECETENGHKSDTGCHRRCNPRVMEELKKRAEYVASQRDKANKRWQGDGQEGDAVAMPGQCLPSSLSPSSSEPEKKKNGKMTQDQWKQVDLIEEVIKKLEGDKSPDHHKARAFFIQCAKKLTGPQVHEALAAVQDKRLGEEGVRHPAAYFRTVATRIMDGTPPASPPGQKGR